MKCLVNVVSIAAVLLLGNAVSADECEVHWDHSIGQPGMDHQVNAFAIFDDGAGPKLYAGGQFTTAGGVDAGGIARWDGAAWSPLGEGVWGSVNALTVFDDGSGPALYAGGTFTLAGGNPAPRIAKWDGSTWSALSDGPSHGAVNALAVFDDGSGPALYVGGSFLHFNDMSFSNIARWDGASWSAVGDDGVNDEVRSLAVYDDGLGGGPALYVGGRFIVAPQGESKGSSTGGCHGICGGQAPEGCWCDDFCCGLGDCCANKCEACSGCLTGSVPCPEGQYVYAIARWDGTSWSDLDGGFFHSFGSVGTINAMAAFDGELIVGGQFTFAGSTQASQIASWNGTAWSPLPSGVDNPVHSLLTFEHDDGEQALFAGGPFSTAGGAPAMGIARWDGKAWTNLNGGTNHIVHALAAFDDGDGMHLYVGGQFTTAGSEPAGRVARWRDCPTPPCVPADINCDGVVDVSDLLILLSAWGECNGPCPADLNSDGVVDTSDLLILLGNWGAEG